MICGIISMSCYTSFYNEASDGCEIRGECFSYGWAYGFGWAATSISLVGAIVSLVGLFISPTQYGGSTTNFKN